MLDRNVQHVLRRFCQALDTPRSLTVWLMISHGEWDDLVSLRVDPHLYEPYYHDGVRKLRLDNLATELLRKCVDVPTSIDTRAVALDNFYQAESQCCRTNLYLERFLRYPVLETALDWRYSEIIGRASSWIARTLGDLPDRLDGRFGPGATFESAQWRHRRSMVAFDKLRNPLSHTYGLSDLVDHLVWETILEKPMARLAPDRLLPVVRGNRFATVPKDATKDRCIAVEPGLNVWGQLSIGSAIRNRLKRRGIDLQFGQEHHRRMAASSSRSGDFSTIDLSNASDTISRNLVKLLIPDLWYQTLDTLRSPVTRLSSDSRTQGSNGWVFLEKFSSMGNGFTFELETLIFCSLLHAVGCNIGIDTWVYGDDIICPRERTGDVLAVLRCSGFTPNPKKTFVRGSFRESCGGDYLLGHDVRAFNLEKLPSDPNEWITFANSLYQRAVDWGLPQLHSVIACVKDQIPSAIRRCQGPRDLGDLVLWNDDPVSWASSTRNSVRWIRVWRPVPERRFLHGRRVSFRPLDFAGTSVCPVSRRQYTDCSEREVALAAAVLGLPSDGLTPRNGVSGYRFGRVPFS